MTNLCSRFATGDALESFRASTWATELSVSGSKMFNAPSTRGSRSKANEPYTARNVATICQALITRIGSENAGYG